MIKQRLVVLWWMVGSFSCLQAETLRWDFETGPLTWQPRAESITVSLSKASGAHEKSTAALSIRGRIEIGWNYVVSDTRPLEGGRLYRLSARLRVDRLGAKTPAPYLKCEFLPAERGKTLGRANTNEYDKESLGRWQRIVGEFRAPAGTRACWVALEKGTNAPTEIEALLDDVVIEPIDRFSIFSSYRLDPVPAGLEKRRGVHPRLYLNQGKIASLKSAIRTTHRPLWEEVRAMADRAVKRGAPKYRRQDSYSGDEQLWQRGVGNTMPYLAMAYALTGDKTYCDSARAWALTSCSYPTWGLGRIDGMDLAAGHQLFGLALVYDWCYHGLDPPARRTIRETLVKRASAMYEAAATEKVWWRRSYLQNHLWVNITGLAAVGLALYDEVPEAIEWVGLPLDKFRRTMAALGDDGASHEGVGYWQYGAEYLLKFMHLADELLQVDLFEHDWWRQTAAYALHLSLPRAAWSRSNCIVDIADCPRGNWYGPDHILRCLAGRFRDSQAQWLADQIDRADIDAASARWLNLIWYDPSVAAAPPEARPTLHHFTDMDIVAARSDWSGGEALLVFKCGPYIGHHAVQEFSYDPGGGHVHPDTGHLVLFALGEWLLRDDGYLDKWTGQHNTLLIDDKGQLGEGRRWFNGAEPLKVKSRPRIRRVSSTEGFDSLTGDATPAYPESLGLKRFRRHLLFLKPNAVIVIDDIQLDQSAELELRFHPEHKTVSRDQAAFLVRGKNSLLRVDPLTPAGLTLSAENLDAPGRHDQKVALFTLRLRTRTARWRNAVAFSWIRPDQDPARIGLEAEDSVWTFRTGSKKLTFHWDDETARLASE